MEDLDSLFALLKSMVDGSNRPFAMAVPVVEGLFEMLPGVPEIVNGIAILRVLGGNGLASAVCNTGIASASSNVTEVIQIASVLFPPWDFIDLEFCLRETSRPERPYLRSST